MLIRDGVNVVKISRRIVYKNPTVTLKIYAHLFDKDEGMRPTRPNDNETGTI